MPDEFENKTNIKPVDPDVVLAQAMGLAGGITQMRFALADMVEGDVALMLIGRRSPDGSSGVRHFVAGQPGAWEIVGLLEYAKTLEANWILESRISDDDDWDEEPVLV